MDLSNRIPSEASLYPAPEIIEIKKICRVRFRLSLTDEAETKDPEVGPSIPLRLERSRGEFFSVKY